MLSKETNPQVRWKQLEKEETESHFTKNFTILEPNCYDDDEANYRKELKLARLGWHIITL
jgi:hypothetical protein